jgi:hypothetical protein
MISISQILMNMAVITTMMITTMITDMITIETTDTVKVRVYKPTACLKV